MRARGFLLGPHIATHGANAEQVDIVGLEKHQRRDRIGGKRTAVVLIVDELFLPPDPDGACLAKEIMALWARRPDGVCILSLLFLLVRRYVRLAQFR